MPLPGGRASSDIGAACEVLGQRFGERFSTAQAVREQHGNTTTWVRNEPPDAVVFAQSTEEVAQIVKTCAQFGCPVIPFGTGTSLEGQVNAPLGGVCIDLSRMNRVLAVHPEDLNVVVEPGITRSQVNRFIRDTGLFFPVDPGADASIGGMAATRASGTNAVRYGTMRDNVISLQCVMANGQVIRTGSHARKSSAGYDLTRIMVGSEGTLGIMTEITLRLHGIPESVVGGVCCFPSVKQACDAVIETIQCGIPVARIELLDALQIAACNAYSKLTLDEKPTLFVEFHGSSESTAEQAALFAQIILEHGGSAMRSADQAEQRSELWKARHDAFWAAGALKPGAKTLSTDACVPISKLADCIEETRLDIEDLGLVAPILGHVGDGNFHVLVNVDPTDDAEIQRTKEFLERLSHRAIAMGGTCTGEHGIGQGKMKYLVHEFGGALEFMAAIKHALDPDGILNPGKILQVKKNS